MTDRRRQPTQEYQGHLQPGSQTVPAGPAGPIYLTNLRQVWQSRVVLDIPELILRPGKRYALLGANGSGKSTLLQLLAEKLADNSGQAGYLPQKPYAFALSVSHNIGLGIPAALGLPENEKQRLIDGQLASLDLSDLAAARGNRLSGGESQRMSLARLLVVPRKIMLLDEPASALDLGSLARAEAALAAYLAQNNCLLVMATHQISLARRLCDEMIFIDQGRILAAGPIAELLDSRRLQEDPDSRLSLFLHYEIGVLTPDNGQNGGRGLC